MTYREWLLRYAPAGLLVPIEADQACRFLESRGFRFLIDFGYQNAQRLMLRELALVKPEGRA